MERRIARFASDYEPSGGDPTRLIEKLASHNFGIGTHRASRLLVSESQALLVVGEGGKGARHGVVNILRRH